LGNGSAWDSTSNFYPERDFPATGPLATESQLIDINGDGLDDWVEGGSTINVYLNNGTGFLPQASQWTIATSGLYASPNGNYYDRGIRFIDMNGDGLPDFVRSYYVTADPQCGDRNYGEVANVHVVYLNTGNGWATTSTPYDLPHDFNSIYSSYNQPKSMSSPIGGGYLQP
jgi:hypothetical protein